MRVAAGGQLIMPALSGEQRPRAAAPEVQERTAVVLLPVSVVSVAPPAGALRQVDFEGGVDDAQGILHQGVAGAADAVADQL